MKVRTKLKLAETIQVAILKITISRAFGTSQAVADSNPPVNWWAIPQMSLRDKDNIQNKHRKQNPKQHLKQIRCPEISACPKKNGDSGVPPSGGRSVWSSPARRVISSFCACR